MTDLPDGSVPRSTSEIASFHAHVYYDPGATRPEAERLRSWIGERFAVTLGAGMTSWWAARSGDVPDRFCAEVFPALVPWLMLNHGHLSILVHPNTTNPRRDHLADPIWIGLRSPCTPTDCRRRPDRAAPPPNTTRFCSRSRSVH